MFDEYFQATANVDHQVHEAPAPVPVIPQGVDDDYHDIEVAHMNNDPIWCSESTDCCSLQHATL